MSRALSNLRFSLATFRRHPLTRDRLLPTLARYARWQFGSRLVPGPVLVPWVNRTHLLISPGMWGATMNHYCGLQDFEPMAFLLHLLRPEDLFLDVGANVGVYSVLAAGGVGARSLAVEPGDTAAEMLLANVHANRLAERVEIHRAGIGATPGVVRFSRGLDTLNHILATSETAAPSVEIPITTIDAVLGGRCPTAVKLDTEGYETPAVAGATATLANPGALALCVEFDGHGTRYGHDEAALHERFLSLGFAPHEYAPLARSLQARPKSPAPTGNVLYLRAAAIPEIQRRLAAAPPFEILGRRI